MSARVLPVEEIVSLLKGVPASRFEPDHIATLLDGVSAEPSSIERFVHFVPGRYTRNLVFRNDAFEVLALCWDKQTASPVHNHAGQECWFLVQEGQFCLEGYRILEGGTCPGVARLEHVDSRHRVSAGALDHRGPANDIHRVTVSRGNPRAVSIHVYARPIDDCLVYDLRRHRCSVQRLKYHSIEGRPVGECSVRSRRS